MDDSWQLRAASARSSSQHFPISVGSRNQIDMNFGQISHPYVAQEVCVIERTIRQEPVQPSTVNYGYSGSTSKMSRPELGNSFLALLSGPSQQFRSEYQQSSSARSAVLAGNSPFFQIGALENGSWPPLTASDVPAAPQTCGNGGFGCGLELSHIGVSRELLPSGFNRVTAFHDNFDSGNLRPNMSDVFKHGNRPSVHDSEAELQASVPQWLTDAANLRQQQLQSMQSARLLKTLAGTGYAEVEQPSSVMKARPRVYCVGTSGMLSGELVLSVTGHLGVLCSCHNQHMPVAKFSEHAGQASGNPGTVVHMENGETIVMWRKAFFSQFGVKVPDDEKGWDWNDGNSSEAGSVKCKTASSQNMDKNNIPSYQTDHSTAKSKNAHFFNSSVYRNNSYESHVAQGLSTGGFLPSAAQKNVHEVRDALFKNFSRVCKGDTPVQRNPQPLERLKDNLSRVPDMSYRGSPNYVNTSVAEYIDFINNGGQAFISSQSPAGIKNFQKGFTLNNLSNIQESVPQKKDAISSGFELRLGQPSQQPHTLGGPLPASLDSQVSNADIDRQKSLFLERMLQRGNVCGPSVAEGTQQNGTCNLPGFLGNKEKGKERHFDNQAQAVGRTNMLQSGCIDHLKYDSAKGSNVSMYLHPGGHPNGPIEEVLMPIMNKVVGDPEQLVNKLMQMNANSHVIKHDIPEGVRNKVMGIPNKGYTQSMEYGYNSSQTKLDMTSGSSVPCDMYGNLASLIQAKQRIDNRLLHDIIPGHCLPPDISMHGKQSLLSEIQKTAVSPIEPDIRNGPNQMAVNSNLGISDHPDAFWLRAINSALSKNSGPALLSAAAQLNIPRTAVAATLSRMADNAENKVNVDACQMQHMSEEHLRSMLGLMGGTHVCKRSEMASSSSNQEPKSDISREQVQLAGLFGSAVVPVQKSFNQDGLGTNISDSIQGMCHRDKQGIGNAFENPAGRHHVRIDQDSLSPHENPDFLGPNSSRSNAPPSEDRNAKISQTKDAFGQQPGCILPTSNDKPLPSLTRHSQKCLDTLAGVLSATKQKDSDRVIVSEKDHPGELESPESKELSRTDPHIAVSKENAMSAALGTNSTVVVSVGENDSGTEKECAGENKNVEGHAIMNTGCESFHSMQDNGKAMADVAVMQDGSPEDLTNSRGTVEDHLADTAAKSSKKVTVDTGSPKKEEQMSNVCSKISDNVFSEFSDAGHVINDDVCNVDSGGKKLMRSDVVDEGSGIGKCCSSDAVDTGVWTRRKLASVNGDKKALVASSLLPNPTSTTDNGVSKVRSSLRLKRVHKSMATIVAETEHPLQTVGRTGKLEKKRRTMKWKRLDDAVRISEDNSKLSVPLSYARKIDSIFVPSDTVGKSYEVRCGTASVSSTPTKICTLKRKRSALVSGNPLTSNCKSQGFQEDRRKVEPVQQVQFKGDKLVIRIRQTSVERKAKKNGADGIDSDFDRTISRKVSSYDAMGSGKTPLFRHNDITLPEDKKLTQRRSSSALRNGIRTGQGKPTLKPAKMASLSSILKHSESHVDTSCKGGGKQTVTGFKNSPLEKDEGKSGKLTVLQRRHLNELRESSDYTVEPNRRRDGKELTGLVNVKEIRKRSLWELTGKHKHENKSSHYPGPGTAAQSKNKCQLDLSNAIGGEFSNNHCPFPRGERTLRLRFKCKSKGNFGKPNLTASTGTSHWFSANHHTTPNILLHSDGVRKSKMYTPDSGFESVFISVVKDDHNVSKCEISPIEEPLSYFTKTNMRKDLNSITLNKKETEDINKPTSGVFKKQKQVKKDEKIQVNIGECREMMGVSCAPKSVCQTIKTKRRSNDGIYGENHGSNSLPKRRRMEDAAHVSNFEADGCCCVCGDLNEQSNNHLVQCGGCLIKVHQACYGVSKLPKSSWTCRACKSNLSNIVCVLCGYGGGAMTRAQKARNVVKNLLPVWQVTRESNSKALAGGLGLACKGNALNEANSKPIPGMSGSIKSELGASRNRIPNLLSFGKQDNNKTCPRGNLEDVVQMGSTQTGKVQNLLNSEFRVHNSITAAVNDPSVTQWVHMVCGLWMPGTRCLNNSTMGVFDVSGATIPRRKVVCSICNRPGGLCIQCRVIKCSVPFHPWCAHQKGLLQSEIEGDHGEKVGFYGRCILHAQGAANDVKEFESRDNLDSNLQSESGEGTCARTEGYKGRKSWEESMAELRRHSDVDSTRVVSQEQINAWLHINGRKSCTRGIIKPPNTDVKADYRREYLRFKQEQRWKRLVVYKSGIHALGLYTAEFISKGEMVVEYVGEIVGLRVADKREANYLNSGGKMQYEGACYFFRIDKESIIDATRKGGIARFVNHSCSPNCVAKVISVRTQKKVVFFAERDINAGEEITYDYHFNHEDDGKKIPCFCNSRNCRRYLN